MPKQKARNYFTMRLDPKLREAIEPLAKADKRSLSAMMDLLLWEAIETRKKKGRPND